eukprot:m.171595 g.171595  ORF g.171595 m.171595 type:complete len:51 (-) comp14553_c0_seq5:72-224(-)
MTGMNNVPRLAGMTVFLCVLMPSTLRNLTLNLSQSIDCIRYKASQYNSKV